MRKSRFFELNMVCGRITLFWVKHGMCANHALSGEISYRKSRMKRSENYYPTLTQAASANYYNIQTKMSLQIQQLDGDKEELF